MASVARSRSVGIIGAGVVAQSVARAVAAGETPGLDLLGFLTRRERCDLPARTFRNVDELLDKRPAVVVEAASHGAVRECAESVLTSGATLVCVSVGALADDRLRGRLSSACAAAGSRLLV